MKEAFESALIERTCAGDLIPQGNVHIVPHHVSNLSLPTCRGTGLYDAPFCRFVLLFSLHNLLLSASPSCPETGCCGMAPSRVVSLILLHSLHLSPEKLVSLLAAGELDSSTAAVADFRLLFLCRAPWCLRACVARSLNGVTRPDASVVSPSVSFHTSFCLASCRQQQA